ncbi:MAG: hypothetical protein H6779_03560 [Candidatus Nomurabacteria bacterium]|nr:hypothetical protein [Candidatus Nomurabacteria bacterium]USN87464.1 MAG: hypothetical protein H6779_03560 [Candidatus Nomurabacteria bacterium]
MSTENRKVVKLGDTFVAYIDDSTTCVGIVIENGVGRNNESSLVLVLSWLTTTPNRLPAADVFDRLGESYGFPTFKEIKTRFIFPYTFENEIKLCEKQSNEWWEEFQDGVLREGCNLVARYFSPKNSYVLTCVDASQKLMQGIDLTTDDKFKYFGTEKLLLLWAVLFRKFPDKVIQYPTEFHSQSDHTVYRVTLEGESVKIKTETRV